MKTFIVIIFDCLKRKLEKKEKCFIVISIAVERYLKKIVCFKRPLKMYKSKPHKNNFFKEK